LDALCCDISQAADLAIISGKKKKKLNLFSVLSSPNSCQKQIHSAWHKIGRINALSMVKNEKSSSSDVFIESHRMITLPLMYVIYSTDETKLTLTSKSNICNHASQGKESCYATKFTFKNHTEGNTSFFLCKEKIPSHDGGLYYPSRAQKSMKSSLMLVMKLIQYMSSRIDHQKRWTKCSCFYT
jgi:hypothetical protein